MENYNLFNTPDHTDEYDYNEVQNDNMVVLALTYILFFLPYIFLPNSRYAKFHANQSLVLLITTIALNIVCSVVSAILCLIPIIGPVIASIISILIRGILLALFIYGIVNVFNKKAKELPIVGFLNIINR